MLKNIFTSAFTSILVLAGLHMYVNPQKMEPVKTPSVVSLQQSVVEITLLGEVCSGYVLKGTQEVVTAAHCLPDDDTAVLQVKFQGDNSPHPFHVKKKGDHNFANGPDLALLYTNDTTIKWPVGLPSCSKPGALGDPLAMFGSPLGTSNNVSFGHLSNVAVDLTERLDGAPYAKNFIGYDGQAMPGNSGGPVVNLDTGCVVGVAEAILGANQVSNYGVNLATNINELGKIQ